LELPYLSTKNGSSALNRGRLFAALPEALKRPADTKNLLKQVKSANLVRFERTFPISR
jgi:hypothetical protein